MPLPRLIATPYLVQSGLQSGHLGTQPRYYAAKARVGLAATPVNASRGSGEGSRGKLGDSGWRRQLYLSATVTVSAGLVARWAKQRADRAYDRYLTSAGIERQDRAFKRSEHYDRISGGAFAVMEAGLLFSTYLLLF